jgi:hypothetical protein
MELKVSVENILGKNQVSVSLILERFFYACTDKVKKNAQTYSSNVRLITTVLPLKFEFVHCFVVKHKLIHFLGKHTPVSVTILKYFIIQERTKRTIVLTQSFESVMFPTLSECWSFHICCFYCFFPGAFLEIQKFFSPG